MKASSMKLFFLVFVLIQNFALDAKTLHAILIADTIHSDIRNIAAPDLKNIQEEMRKIAVHTKSKLKEKTFSGSDFSKDKVTSYLENLSFGPTDSVVFYFSGHGYRTMQKVSPLPNLSFEFYKNGLDMKWVADTIWNKKPRFALILADCCNNYAENGFNNETKNVYINLHKKPEHNKGYDQLFSKAKGCLVVCSSTAGQYSYGSHFGGLFTHCFLVSLNKEIAEPTPSWKNLLLRANRYISHIQKPFCQVYR
ncbi:MAG: caspase family protein [Parachlamydiaceae bacterium]|nr:caspase family protein [Parachlamydiaceae bacterium]